MTDLIVCECGAWKIFEASKRSRGGSIFAVQIFKWHLHNFLERSRKRREQGEGNVLAGKFEIGKFRMLCFQNWRPIKISVHVNAGKSV